MNKKQAERIAFLMEEIAFNEEQLKKLKSLPSFVIGCNDITYSFGDTKIVTRGWDHIGNIEDSIVEAIVSGTDELLGLGVDYYA